MLSQNNVTSTNKISSVEEQSLMRKLNKRKIRWIVREVERRELGVWTIAQTQNITKQHAYRVAKKYKNCEPILKSPGRKPKEATDEERKIVTQTYKEIRVSATMIEQYLDEKGIHIGHNKIHKILLSAKLAKNRRKRTEENGLDMKGSIVTAYGSRRHKFRSIIL